MSHRIRATVAALAIGLGISGSASAETVRLMTGPQGGVWVPLGGALKGIWEKAVPGLTVQSLPGAGIANMRGVEEGKAEIGFGNSISTVDALNGSAPFTTKAKNICQMATLYPQYFQVVALASSNVNTIADLKGKSIAVQTRGNTAEIITQHILKAYGLDYQQMGKVNFLASYNDAVSQMQDGHAQVFTLGTTVPSSAVMDLASVRDVKMIGITDDKVQEMKKINPGYNAVTIKGGTYPKLDKDVQVIGYATHLVASCKLPENQVYAMVKSLHASVKDLSAINKPLGDLTPKMMAEDIGVPLHPGATKFYQEAGAL